MSHSPEEEHLLELSEVASVDSGSPDSVEAELAKLREAVYQVGASIVRLLHSIDTTTQFNG